MADLFARIDGAYIPLTACAWALRAPCGCIVGINIAASDDGERVYATPASAIEQLAWGWDEDLNAEGLARMGFKAELMPFKDARKDLAFNCKHEEEKADA